MDAKTQALCDAARAVLERCDTRQSVIATDPEAVALRSALAAVEAAPEWRRKAGKYVCRWDAAHELAVWEANGSWWGAVNGGESRPSRDLAQAQKKLVVRMEKKAGVRE